MEESGRKQTNRIAPLGAEDVSVNYESITKFAILRKVSRSGEFAFSHPDPMAALFLHLLQGLRLRALRDAHGPRFNAKPRGLLEALPNNDTRVNHSGGHVSNTKERRAAVAGCTVLPLSKGQE